MQHLETADRQPPLPVSISIRKNHPARRVILLHCLDSCYGHALTMLLNVQRHERQHPGYQVIVLVPEALGWLVPATVAEAWVVHARVGRLNRRLEGLDEFIWQEVQRFEEVQLSDARIHYDHGELSLLPFTRVPPFALDAYDHRPATVSFIAREDRLWLSPPEALLLRFYRKSGLSLRPFVALQNRRWRQLAGLIQRHLPGTRVQVIGMGQTGSLPGLTDLRLRPPLTSEQEQAWAAAYARSHVVVGVHGSHLLLPTGLAGSFVELLPDEKIVHLGEATLQAHRNPNHQHLLGRFLPLNSSPGRVAAHVLAMLREFPHWLSEQRERTAET